MPVCLLNLVRPHCSTAVEKERERERGMIYGGWVGVCTDKKLSLNKN